VGRAAAVLKQPRAIAFVAVAAGLTAYYYAVESIPALPTWWDVALLVFGLIPAVFLLDLLALPLARARGLLPLSLGLGVLALLAELGDLKVLGNFAKLAAVTFFAFWFLRLFQELAVLVIVALIIPWVDAYSVFRGPTGEIVEKHPHVFTHLSFGFPLPGHQTARLGLPDLLFFALFLAAAQQYRLRPNLTWLGMVALLGATVAIAEWTGLDGLPALPALSLGFLLPNVDRIWARLRPGKEERRYRSA
jgi:hypothetical protein